MGQNATETLAGSSMAVCGAVFSIKYASAM